MIKKDLSIIALVFFVTRCFFSIYPVYNIGSFLLNFLIILIGIIVLKHIKLQNKVTRFLYLLVICYLFIIVLMNAAKFININYFRYNNFWITILSLLVISYIIGKEQIKTIGSISEIFIFIFIIVSVVAITGLFSLIRLNNYTDFVKFEHFSLKLYPIFMLFLFLYINNNNIITGYLLGSISSLLDIILLVGCLGNKLINNYHYPGIAILKSLNLFHFINHLDKFFSFIYLFEYTITLAFMVHIILSYKKITN